MRVVITENCMFIPHRKYRWPPHRLILLQKAPIHRCTFCKNRFFIIKIWIYGENTFKRWQVATNTWQPFTHDWICHLSFTWLNVCRLQPIQMKEILLLKFSGACFRYILIYSANVFLSHSSMPANAKTIWQCRQKDGNCNLVLSPIVLPIYNPPSSSSDEDRQNWIIDPFI